jgi:hypothetical protein
MELSSFISTSYQITVTGQSLINGVIYDFVNKVVESAYAYISNVHGWAHTHVLHAF